MRSVARTWISYKEPPPSVCDDLVALAEGIDHQLDYIVGQYLEQADWYCLDPDYHGEPIDEHLFVLWMTGHLGHFGAIYHSVSGRATALCLHVFGSTSGCVVPEAAVRVARTRLQHCSNDEIG